MKILYDGYIFSAQRNGGISRYFASLIKRLPESWTPTVRPGKQPNLVRVNHPRLRQQHFPFNTIRPQVLSYALARPYFKLLDSTCGFQVLHPTYHFRLPRDLVRRGRQPVVITVYDMIPEIYQDELDPDGVETMAKRSAIESADAIICISESTRRDLQERYAIPDARITVTYLASDLTNEMGFGPEAIPETPYFIFLGNRGVYKNFARTLLAFSRIAKEWRELKLCVVGDALNGNEVELVRALNLEGRVVQMGFIDDAHLAKLYRCSEALCYPSLYEGFGIPPLEAMTCGTVVITSDRSSLPEVVGDAAITVNPDSVEEIAEALLSLRSLGSRRQAFIERGLERARQFNWNETARRTIEVYKSVAN